MKEDHSFVIGRITVDGEDVCLLCDGVRSHRYHIRYADGREAEEFDGLCQAFAFMQRKFGHDIIGSAIDWNKPIEKRPV